MKFGGPIQADMAFEKALSEGRSKLGIAVLAGAYVKIGGPRTLRRGERVQ